MLFKKICLYNKFSHADFNLIVRTDTGDMMDNEILEILNEILQDRAVPRNIRSQIEIAVKKIEENTDTSLSEVIYLLDDISNDMNLPEETRTDIWHVISLVEAAKEQMNSAN